MELRERGENKEIYQAKLKARDKADRSASQIYVKSLQPKVMVSLAMR